MEFVEFSNILKIKKLFTSPYHPQSNAVVKNFNKTLNNMLSCFINDQLDDWYWLPFLRWPTILHLEHPTTLHLMS